MSSSGVQANLDLSWIWQVWYATVLLRAVLVLILYKGWKVATRGKHGSNLSEISDPVYFQVRQAITTCESCLQMKIVAGDTA